MFKKLLLVTAMFAGGGLMAVEAAPVLSFNYSSTSVTVGNPVSVDVVLSGLDVGAGEILSAFDLDIDYDPLIMSILSESINAFPPSPFGDNLSFSDPSVPGDLHWTLTSLELDDATLQGLQSSGSVTLGTIVFSGLRAGTSALTFDIDPTLGRLDLTGANYDPLLLDGIHDGAITFVPEPATMLLIGLGAVGMAGAKRKTKLDAA